MTDISAAPHRPKLMNGLILRCLQAVAALTVAASVVFALVFALALLTVVFNPGPATAGGAKDFSATVGLGLNHLPQVDISHGPWSTGVRVAVALGLAIGVGLSLILATGSVVAFQTLGRVARGELFSGRIAKGFSWTGWVLVVVPPIVCVFGNAEPWVGALAVLLGAVFLVFGAAIRQGAAMQTELDEIL